MKDKSILSIVAWCFYDWASSSFSVIVTTFIFAIYFTGKVSVNPIIGTYHWANAISLAGIIIALCGPFVGAIADRSGHHKLWMFFLTSIAVLCCALLWFAYPHPSSIIYMLTLVIIGTVAYELAQIFYNAFLPLLAPEKYLGRISGIGWGSGYLGGIVALSIALLIFIKSNWFHFNTQTSQEIRICGPFVALWYAFFSLPIFILGPKISPLTSSLGQAIREGWQDLKGTLKKLPSEKNIFLYLIAHMIYTDGLNTLFAFGGIYAAGTFGLSFEQVLLFGISMNVTAGLGAILLGWADDFLGSKLTVITSLICLTTIGLLLLIVKDEYSFWSIALTLSIFIGPVQSASRSLMVRLIKHKTMSAEMFGLYALSGKVTSFVGPWLLGEATYFAGSQRAGMGTILIFFAIGAILLLPIKIQQ